MIGRSRLRNFLSAGRGRDGVRALLFAAIGAGLVLAWPDMTRAADDPAALILDIAGASEPELFPFSEVTAGAKVALADDATLTFVHYGSCREVSMTGGEIAFERRRYRIKGGRVLFERTQDCPREVALNEDGTAAGLLMRGGDGSGLHLGVRPRFVLVGAKADGVVAARFVDGETEIAAVPVARRLVAWPADQPDLNAGDAYAVDLIWADGTRIRYPFEASGRVRKARVLLRLD